jgi:hypothetical protein
MNREVLETNLASNPTIMKKINCARNCVLFAGHQQWFFTMCEVVTSMKSTSSFFLSDVLMEEGGMFETGLVRKFNP